MPITTNDETPHERRPYHRRHSRIPVDTVAWALCFGLLLPLGIFAGWFRPEHHFTNKGENMLLGLALAFGVLGTILLAVARYPLYVRRHHQGFRPRELPHNYRPLFWVSYVLILVGMAILLTLVAAQHWS